MSRSWKRQFERPEVDIPDAIVDFLQADVFLYAAHADVDPLVIPADAAVVADEPFLESVWIFLQPRRPTGMINYHTRRGRRHEPNQSGHYHRRRDSRPR